ncbi:hypothetical protein K493DRAFT_332649 [Basidiobolus meristosporus CBS 931.73]|uniref:Uncharacterized protein n=1 Tax=Basidiobolus meristosporus CBS 931.73 TaxID=1314790 RepID=A0A1Y1ZC24_9FUNG|nr:hypothetical protein K493DRAFT_332649 [Basidiobolus meristosporus CBS 931.73]|eukprot:ORY07736.1 hypothetical protein K493DRAFT_332649 [Basidiobolus meristosporus CBS 931.73]
MEPCPEPEDAEYIDPIYLQPCNEFTEQHDDDDDDFDNESLCNSIQYSEHTHILDVEPPAFSVFGDESVYEASLADSTVARRKFHDGHLLNKGYDHVRYGLKNYEDTIYENDYLDRTYLPIQSSDASKYRTTLQKNNYSLQRSEPKSFTTLSNDEPNDIGLFQDDGDSVSSRRSSAHYDASCQRLRRVESDYLGRHTYYDTAKGHGYDGACIRDERKKPDSDFRDLYSIDNYKERDYTRFDNNSSSQSYSLRDDVSSREGSVDTSVRYSPCLEEHPLGRRSSLNTPMPSSPNPRYQHGRHALFDRYDRDILRRSRSNISEILLNSARSPITSPRENGSRISPMLPEAKRIPRAHSPSVASSHSVRNLIPERTNRRNRYTISNPGDLRSEPRGDFRPSSRLSMGTSSAHPTFSDTASQSTSGDFRSRKLNEVKFEIFRAVHRVKLALDALAEDSRAHSINTEVQGIQDLNEMALQTMIEQFEHVHEMLGEGEGSVGARRPISPLSDESYGKLIPNDTKKFGITEDTNYGRQSVSEEMNSSGYAKSNASSPNLYSHRPSYSSRLDRNTYVEPPLSPSPSQISKWQSLIEDSKTPGLLANRLRSTTFDR